MAKGRQVMWIFTKIGFFSGTLADFTSKSYADMPRPEDWQTTPYIMVRARVLDDLVRLVEFNTARGGSAPAIFSLQHHDYPYRILMTRDEWGMLVALLVADIDYSNFKNAVTSNARTREEGDARHSLYLRVWGVMSGAEGWLQRFRTRQRIGGGRQGSLGFWENRTRFRDDPRTDADMQAHNEPRGRGWQEWLEGTNDSVDIEDAVIDDPTQDDIAAFEVALLRSTTVRRRKKGR